MLAAILKIMMDQLSVAGIRLPYTRIDFAFCKFMGMLMASLKGILNNTERIEG